MLDLEKFLIECLEFTSSKYLEFTSSYNLASKRGLVQGLGLRTAGLGGWGPITLYRDVVGQTKLFSEAEQSIFATVAECVRKNVCV